MGIQIRTFTWDDAPALVDLFNESLVADGESSYISLDYLKQRYSVATAQPENSLVVWDDNNNPIGANMTLFSVPAGKGLASLYLHPDWRKSNMPDQLIIKSDKQLLAYGEKQCKPDQPIYLLRGVEAHLTDRVALLERIGYESERHFYGMLLDLPKRMRVPSLKSGLVLKAFDPEKHAEAIHQAYDLAFRDAWGYQGNVPLDSWKRTFMTDKTDYSMWHGIWAGDKMVGFTINLVDPAGIEQGKVRSLGVIPDYRRKGIAMMLLKHSFKQFKERKLKRAALNVDSNGATQPLKLYQKAGMEISTHSIIFRRILRGTAADIAD